ncbi:hypothetical protein FRX31_010682, partial [Thalictrum thalictroides]
GTEIFRVDLLWLLLYYMAEEGQILDVKDEGAEVSFLTLVNLKRSISVNALVRAMTIDKER